MDQFQQAGSLGLDQIADAVNRQKLGSQRMKNEMMRLGATDPTSFSMNNQSFLQQAQQPSEFLGANRHEYDPNQTDPNLLSALGESTQKVGDQNFYYGDYDPTKAAFAKFDSNSVDLGNGKYQIMYNGQNLGTGYKSLQDTLNDYGYGSRYTGNNAKDWETLGQVLNNQLTKPATATTPVSANQVTTLGQIFKQSQPTIDQYTNVGNKQADPITGENALYGSSPIVYDGKLLGYSVPNVRPDMQTWNNQSTYGSGSKWFGNAKTHTVYDLGYSLYGRDYQSPSWWGANTTFGTGGNSFLVSPDKTKDISGWKNVDDYQRYQGETKQSNGFFGQNIGPLAWSRSNNPNYNGLLGAIDRSLYATDGGFAFGSNLGANALGFDNGLQFERTYGEPIGNIIGAIFAEGLPIGSLIAGADNISTGNEKGFWNNVANGIASYAASNVNTGGTGGAPVETGVSTSGTAANGMSGSSGGVFGSGVSLGSTATNQAAQNMIINAARNYATNGGDVKSALASALFSSASGMAGNELANSTQGYLGDIGSKSLGGAASGALNSLFNKNSPIQGSLYGAMSGGLHGYLNSISRGNEGTLSDEKNKQNGQVAANTTKLAKLFSNRNK